ncbi:endonuclease VII domain-containing protein [Kineosporia sp. NBRC 101731]|uniref:endonuclease VII domain-containing protein n=1 Tax=Kineosporia sp. NBRC 101731 TaxID=3032199 RepID=UPI0033177217
MANGTAVCSTCGPVEVRVSSRDGKLRTECPRRSPAALQKQKLAKYGLTPERYEEMLEQQQGRCAICRRDEPLVIDHDHLTGIVRELLCNKCNCAIGLLRDDPALVRASARYLERHAQLKIPI